MRFLNFIVGVLALALSTCSNTNGYAETSDYKIAGNWSGSLDTGTAKLKIILTISEDKQGQLQAVLETPDQAPGRKIPVNNISTIDDQLHFRLQTLGASYDGQWNNERQSWIGKWKQSGQELSLDLKPGLPQAKATIPGMDGIWKGSITRNNQKTRFVISIQTSKYGTAATFGSPDYGISGLAVEALSRSGSSVRFVVPATGVEYSGQLTEDTNSMTGTWKFPGRPDGSVTFIRTSSSAEPEVKNRPQQPEEPFNYHVEEVKFNNPENQNVVLAGTLTLPHGSGPFSAAILISGSGPQDRDESVWTHKPFAVLADHLTRQGIAVLRYDDRGFGESTGLFTGATSADFATDANAAVAYLMSRSEINHQAIGFIGHSEGGVIAPIATVNNLNIAFMILLAAPGTDFAEIAISQRNMFSIMQGATESELTVTEPVVRKIYRVLKDSETRQIAESKIRAMLTPLILKQLGTTASNKEALIKELSRDWLRYLFQYNPAQIFSQINIPVLALNGTLDKLVPADPNLKAIGNNLTHNADVTITKLQGLNHLFQTAQTGGLGEYSEISETFSPTALDIISDWVKARF